MTDSEIKSIETVIKAGTRINLTLGSVWALIVAVAAAVAFFVNTVAELRALARDNAKTAEANSKMIERHDQRIYRIEQDFFPKADFTQRVREMIEGYR